MNENLPATPRAAAWLEAEAQRSVAARIRELMPWIKEQFTRGYTHAQVASALEADGLKVSVATLRRELYRKPKMGSEERQPQLVTAPDSAAERAPRLSSQRQTDVVGEPEGQTPRPPVATARHMTMEEAMDPRKRAAYVDQFFRKEPLVIKPKRKA